MSAQHNDSSDLQTADSGQIFSLQMLCTLIFLAGHSLNYQHFVPSFKHPMLDDVSPIDPLPAKCFYERDAMNLRLWKKPLPFFVDM